MRERNFGFKNLKMKLVKCKRLCFCFYGDGGVKNVKEILDWDSRIEITRKYNYFEKCG